MIEEHLLGGDEMPFTGFEFTDETGTVETPELKLRVVGQAEPTVLPITMDGDQGSVDLAGIQNVTGVQVSVSGDPGVMTPPEPPQFGVYINTAASVRGTAEGGETDTTFVSVDASQYPVPCYVIAVIPSTEVTTVVMTAGGESQTFAVSNGSGAVWSNTGAVNVTDVNISTVPGGSFPYTPPPVDGTPAVVVGIAFDWSDATQAPTVGQSQFAPEPPPGITPYPIPSTSS